MDRESKTYDADTSNDGWVSLALPAGILVLISILVSVDLVSDFAAGVSLGHILFEVAIVIAAVLGAVLLFYRLRQTMVRERARAQAAIARVQASNAAWREQAAFWRARHEGALRGLAEAIESQFVEWELTPAEAEVALLLLKGLSFKEIGGVREVSERTARDQARAVYRKGNLSNRGELAAFFLEDFLIFPDQEVLPITARASEALTAEDVSPPE